MSNLTELNNISTYNFYNKDWYIAADIVRHFKLSSSYNTYYSKNFSNNRLFGPTKSYEFRLSGTYLEEFKRVCGLNNSSLNRTSAVWLIDKETAYKLLVQNNIIKNTNTVVVNSQRNVITIESNAVSIDQHLNVTNKQEEQQVYKQPNTTNIIKEEFQPPRSILTIGKDISKPILPSEEDISDAITLLSSKLTNTPYQQEKLLNGGSIRLDLFLQTRRSITTIELKKGFITLDMIKEKLEDKHYLRHLTNEYPDYTITFIFSSPIGISFEGLLYLQEISSSIEQKVIYKPTSNLILDMINKKEKELPSYYFKQILDKPIIKYLLQVN